jgi:TatD DNase family protein
MASPLVDSHCHIAGPEFADDLDAVVDRAKAAGLAHAFVILAADDEPELRQAAAVSARWPDVRYAIGVHPHAAGKFPDGGAAADQVRRCIERQSSARAVGEIGLDYHYDYAPREAQQSVFRAQMALARELALPIAIHTREAEDDTFAILAETPDVRGVFHCFTGDRDMARRALDIGFYISLAGIVTFPRALELKEVAKMVPLDRLLIETDSPFLAPVPYRGARNEPAHVVRVAEVIAELRGSSPAAIGEAALDNFRRLFRP